MHKIHENLRGVFMGSGLEGMNNDATCAEILRLVSTVKKDNNKVQVLYIGTATYDDSEKKEKQTDKLKQAGCEISSLDLAHKETINLQPEEIKTLFENADVILVSGGNTLFAVDVWLHHNLRPHFEKAMEKGSVLCGGSAGAICWFESGHSDSMDPESFLKRGSDEKKDWSYIRVDGLGLLPGLICPHHDKIQSNGILRAHDLEKMLLMMKETQNANELAICIDHHAGLSVEGNKYKVISSGSEGSVLWNDKDNTPVFTEARDGQPGIWLRQVVENEKKTGFVVDNRHVTENGVLSELLATQETITQYKDPKAETCRNLNPY